MNRKMFESGRRSIQGILLQAKQTKYNLQGTFMPIFFSAEDFDRSYALIA
jgi:hypothetical protein